jgi:hypothetical protein
VAIHNGFDCFAVARRIPGNSRLACSLPHLAGFFAVLILICHSGCSVPLAPGYQILKESREVHFVSGPPSHLEIGVRYSLENTGTIELEFIDVILPDEKTFGRKNVRVEMNGQTIAPEQLTEQFSWGPQEVFRVKVGSWEKRQRRELLVAYDFVSPQDSGARITLSGSDFHLGSRGWAPALEPPKRILAPYPKRPNHTLVTIRVPSNFAVLSRGTAAGRKQNGGEAEYRFQLRKLDLEPYMVAGGYADSSTGSKSSAVVFWTHEPLPRDSNSAAPAVAAAWGVLQANFGPLDKNIRNAHVVEASELRPPSTSEEGPAAVPFPGGVLVNPAALHLGIASDSVPEIVIQALARNWFGEEVAVSDAGIGMGQGLPEYAAIVIDEARSGEDTRRARVVKFLRDYDQARKQAPEKPLRSSWISDPIEQRRIALAKAPLFYIALEDSYGEQPVRHGLRDLAELLRGKEAGYDDLRAAVERTTGKDLSDIFHVWLDGKGIPDDFRAKYERAHQTQPGAAKSALVVSR